MQEKKKHGARNAVIIIVCVLIALCGAGYYAATSVLGRMNRVNPDEFDYVKPEDETFETTHPDAAAEGVEKRDADSVVWDKVDALDGKHVINILLIGQDRREGESRARSDTMILVSVNTERKSISLVSLMRDLYVQIPGYSDNRINAAYQWGGMELLDETVLENFGVEVDGNVEADFEQFETIIDILGGVDVEMSKGEAEYMKYVMESGDVQEGENHLSGKQALDFARMRGLDDDFHRTERQRRLLTRLAQKLQSASAQQLLDLVNEVLPHVSTDMSSTQMLGYAASAIQVYLSGAEIATGRIPAEGMYSDAEIRGMQVLVPNLEKCQSYLSELIYGAAQAEE